MLGDTKAYSGFSVDDLEKARHFYGELLGITEWASADALAAWRENPEHRKAQERGRQAFYADYEISVCTPLHEYSFKQKA